MILARRDIPQSVSGNPVDNNGSIDPAAEGSIAHRGPTAFADRKATLGRWKNGRTGFARANCSCTEGSSESSHAHDFPRSLTCFVVATPALLIPLLKRNIQIQPPGKI